MLVLWSTSITILFFFFFKQKTAYEMRISDWSSDVCSSDLLVPIAGGYGYYLGNGAGEAQGYARARDETAAASWANTTNGKLARRIDQASEQTIPAIAACPKDHGWKREKRDGAYWCFGANPDAKSYTGWLLP